MLGVITIGEAGVIHERRGHKKVQAMKYLQYRSTISENIVYLAFEYRLVFNSNLALGSEDDLYLSGSIGR